MIALGLALEGSNAAQVRASGTVPYADLGPNLVPAHGALLGTWSKPRAGRTAAQELTYVEQELGHPMAIYHVYEQDTSTLPSPAMQAAAASGHIILMGLAPHARSQVPVWREIADGTLDDILSQRIQELKTFGYPVMLNLDHEADAHTATGGTPAEFVAAWRHMHALAEAQGATNIIWVWDMTGNLFTHPADADAIYPGNAYVDWIAADAYNWAPGRSGSVWRSFQAAFQPFYAWGLATGKPMMAEETATQESPTDPAAKAAWIDAAANTVKDWPQMKAVVWFNSDRIYPWWFDSSTQSLTAMRSLANDPYFNPEAAAPASAPVNTAPPRITGPATVGSTLTASAGTWAGATSFTYAWMRCTVIVGCTAIGGATSSTYTPSVPDVAGSLVVEVTASNAAGTTSATSSQTASVITAPAVPIGSLSVAPRTFRVYTEVKLGIKQPSNVTMTITNRQGVVVRHRLTNLREPAGVLTLRWSGVNDAGRRVPAGSYTIHIRAVTTQATATRSAAVVVR